MTHNISFPVSFLALAEDMASKNPHLHTWTWHKDLQRWLSRDCLLLLERRGMERKCARPPSGLLTVTPEEQPSGRRPPRSAAVFRAINTSISVKREEMESSCDYNREQMAGSAGDLEVTPLAKLINKVLLFFFKFIPLNMWALSQILALFFWNIRCLKSSNKKSWS